MSDKNIHDLPIRLGDQGIGPPPDYFDSNAVAAWDDVVRATAPGVLLDRYRAWLEVLAISLARWREGRYPPNDIDTQRMKVQLQSMLGDAGIESKVINQLMDRNKNA